MDNTEKLINLMEGTEFKGIPDFNSEYPLMNLGLHNCIEFDKLSQERKERISDCISAIMADIFQPLALKQFGHTGDWAMQTVIYNKLFPKYEAEELISLGQQMRKEVLGIGLSKKQADELDKWFMSCFSTWFVACIVEFINRWQLLPRITARKIADTLTTMFMEVENANSERHNQFQEEQTSETGQGRAKKASRSECPHSW